MDWYMSSFWEKGISILAGNLNSGHSYLITAVKKIPLHKKIYLTECLNIRLCNNFYLIKRIIPQNTFALAFSQLFFWWYRQCGVIVFWKHVLKSLNFNKNELWGVSSVPFPLRFPFQLHCELVNSLLALDATELVSQLLTQTAVEMITIHVISVLQKR